MGQEGRRSETASFKICIYIDNGLNTYMVNLYKPSFRKRRYDEIE